MEKVYEENLAEIFKVTDRLYFRRANLPVRGQCNGAFIVGDAGVAVVDAPPEGIEMAGEARKLFGKPITALILTHGHGDHTAGLPGFLEGELAAGLTVYSSRRLLETLAPAEHRYKSNFVGIDGRLDISFSGGVDLELFTPPDPMHSKGDLFVRIPEGEILCAGDALVEYRTAYFDDADVRSWISNLRLLSQRRMNLILSGHGPELFPWTYIDDFADFLAAVERIARTCLEKYQNAPGQTDDERFASVAASDIRDLVAAHFAESSPDVCYIEERAGKADAQREVRMVLWKLIREFIRP
jgi:glyoxylase-like metal-dependent hydrolase (beta-lactamase superfamily II)